MTMDRSTRVERALPALFEELAQIAPDGTFLIVHDWMDNTDRRVDPVSDDATLIDLNGDDPVFIQRRAP
jgi:hypothetical protein